jgi:hypothetical protein
VLWPEKNILRGEIAAFDGHAVTFGRTFERPVAEALSLAFLNALLTDEVVHGAAITDKQTHLALTVENCRLVGISMANIANGRTLYEQCYQWVKRRFNNRGYVSARLKHKFAATLHHIVYPYYVDELMRIMMKNYQKGATASRLFSEVVEQAIFVSGERKREGFGSAFLRETFVVNGEYWKERLGLRLSVTDMVTPQSSADRATQTSTTNRDIDWTKAVATAAAESAVEMFHRCCCNHLKDIQGLRANGDQVTSTVEWLEAITPPHSA